MKTFQQFVEESKMNPIKVINYPMAKPNLGLPKGKAFAKRSSSSAGGGGKERWRKLSGFFKKLQPISVGV